MSISTSDLEERILTLEREIWRLPDLDERRIRLTAFEQQIMKLGMLAGSSGGGSTPPPVNTLFSGTLNGCFNLGSPGTISIDGGAGVIWSGATDANGNYSGTVEISVNTPVTVTGTPDSPRLESASISATLVKGGTNSLAAILAPPASGLICMGLCATPISSTLNLHHVFFGTTTEEITMTYSAANSRWEGVDTSGNTYTLDAATFTLKTNGVNSGGPWTTKTCDPLHFQNTNGDIITEL